MNDSPIIKQTDNKLGKNSKKLNKVLTRKMGWWGVLVVSVVYLFWGFFETKLKDESIWSVLLSSAILIVIALAISNLMGAQGIMDGSLDEDVVAMKKEHINIVNESNEYAEYSDEWSEEENAIALRSARKHILMSAGLKYDLFFNADGDFLDTIIEEPPLDAPKYIKVRYENKQKAIKKALTFQVTPVTMARLSAETSVELDPNRMDKEPAEYQVAKAVKSLWQKILSVAVFGKVGWVLVDGQNALQALFNGSLQLVVFLLFGVLSYYGNYIYMTNTYVGNLRKKINLLKRLIVFGKKQRQKEVNQIGNEIRRSDQETANASKPTETVSDVTSEDVVLTGSESLIGTT